MPAKSAAATIPGVTSPHSELTPPEAAWPVQAAVLGEKQGHGNARKDAADNGERMVTAALGAGFHHDQ
jgi:hypothetical protein